MEVAWFSMPKEGREKLQQDQDHVNCVFWLGRCCPSLIHPAPGQITNKEYYLNIPCRLRNAIGQKRPQLWATWLAASSQQCAPSCIKSHPEFFGETSKHQGDSAPYSPDLVPCDLWLFPKLKWPLKGKRFQTIDEIQENTMGQLMVIGRTVRSQCSYFEGDWGVIILCTMFLVSCMFFTKCLYFL